MVRRREPVGVAFDSIWSGMQGNKLRNSHSPGLKKTRSGLEESAGLSYHFCSLGA
jgi:hypothetical protein